MLSEKSEEENVAISLGLEPTQPDLDRHAMALVDNDYNFQLALVDLRKKRGYSIEEIAQRMGVAVEKVQRFESYDYDPKLSELRRYAMAIEILYDHKVTKAE